MKIGIFTDSYLPYTSGVVRSIQTFTEELTALGHEVYIFAPSYRNCDKESRVFRFASIPSPTNPGFTLAVPFSLKLRPTIKQLELDLIHVHSPFLLGRVGAKYARRLGVPLVFTYHTLYDKYVHYLPFAKTFSSELAQKISRDFCNICDLVIVPTDIVGDYLRDIGVLAPINRIPTGIKISDYREGDRGWLQNKYKIKPEDKILLFVGRLGKEKNIFFLMESFRLVHNKMANAVLVLVGDGPEKEELKNKAAELDLEKKVLFTGTLSHEDVINCYTGASLFVFPSVTETQGIVIAEAKAAGLPVVAIKAYGVSEMVEDGIDGYLTELVPEQFAAKVHRLLRDEKLKEDMGNRARANANKLASTNCTARLIDSYQGLLAKRNKRGNGVLKRTK